MPVGTRKRREGAVYDSFAGELKRRARLHEASFVVGASDAEPIREAKRRFGPRAVGRFIVAVLKAVTALCRSADHK
jgi:hypothetical protein